MHIQRLILPLLVSTTLVPGFNVSLDYSFDSNNFFGNPVARAAVDQAAADISAAVTTSLSAVTQNSVSTGTGGDSLTIGGHRAFSNPSTGAQLTRDYQSNPIAADTYVIYVGSRNLSGATLGQGGFSSSVGGSSFFGGPTGLSQAGLNAGAAAYTTEYGRGGGPVMSSFELNINGHTATVSNGPIHGQLWFDHDTNNDGTTDDASQLASSWHFDHTIPVVAGLSDLYSVALHEIVHAIGFGGSESWNNLLNGTEYLGSAGIALNGTGIGLIDADGGHIADNTMSPSIVDGSMQEVLMGPSITTGTRKTLTELDLAILEDMGYTTIQSIPEPSSFILLGLSFLVLGRRHRA